MTDETRHPEGNVTPRDYYEARLLSVERALMAHRDLDDERFRAVEHATALARSTFDARLENTNEWRASMNDQLARFVARVEYDALQLETRRLQAHVAVIEGRFLALGGIAVLLAAVDAALRFFK
jgi:hypothetical protein